MIRVDVPQGEIVARLSIKTPGLPEFSEPLGEEGLVLGSGTGTAILTLPDPQMAPEHARLSPTPDGGYTILDLGGGSGTFVNDTRVTEPRCLGAGDSISMGATRILFVAEDESDDGEGGICATQTLLDDGSSLPAGAQPPGGGTAPCFVLQYKLGTKMRIWHLGQAPVRIGRNRECELSLPDPSLSGCHAVVGYDSGGYYIRDEGSTNGVWVNGQRVSEARLRPGTRIRMGRVVMGFKEWVPRPNLPGEQA